MRKRRFFLSKKQKEALVRLKNIQHKQELRLQAVKKARKELRDWSDIPFSWHKGSIARILHYPENEYPSDSFLYALAGSFAPMVIWRDEVLARAIPLKWFE